MLTKFQVYERLASKWQHPVLMGLSRCPTVDGRAGLCLNVADMWCAALITEQTKIEIYQEIDLIPGWSEHSAFKFPLTLEGAAQRTKFCQEQMERSRL